MFIRLVDVFLMKTNGEVLKIVDHEKFPNTYQCDGTIEKYSGTQVDTMQLSIFNLDPSTRGLIALGGYSTILVNFGWKYSGNNSGSLSKLFMGQIQRITNEKMDAITTETKFWVYDNGDFCDYGFYEGSYGADVNYFDIVQDILKKTSYSPEAYQFTKLLKEKKTVQSKTIYGSSNQALSEIADDAGLVYRNNSGEIAILDPKSIYNSNDVYNLTYYSKETNKIESQNGLVNIPELQNNGISFNIIINTDLDVYKMVKLDNSIISISSDDSDFMPDYQPGATLDSNGLYIITRMTINFNNGSSTSRMTCKALARDWYLQTYGENNE